MFRFNPYNFTITIDEQIQPPGIPQNYIQLKNAAGQSVWAPPGSRLLKAKGKSLRVTHQNAAGKTTSLNFAKTYASQQAPIRDNVLANVAASQQASPPLTPGVMTPIQKQVMLATALAKRARQKEGTGANPGTPPVYPPSPPPTGANPGTPPVYPPSPLPPPPTGAGSPPPPSPATTPTRISARRQKADTVVGGVASAFSSIGGSTNRRPDRFGDPGRLIQGLYDAGKAAYDYMKTPGTPGSAATATSPAVAATPGRFDLRGGGRIPRAGVAGALGLIAGGPVGGVVGAALGALTGRGQPRKPIPEERYYRVYKMISQHDHR